MRSGRSYNGSMPTLSQPAPDFELSDLAGVRRRLSDYRGQVVVLNFWSCECPHSERTDRSLLSAYAQQEDQVVLLTIAPNSNEDRACVEGISRERGLPIVLLDEGNAVADLYEAQTTPEAFVIDREGFLRFHGAVDDVSWRQRTATRFFVEEAVKALLEGSLPEVTERTAIGCAIVRNF